jgi:hypothetical protein
MITVSELARKLIRLLRKSLASREELTSLRDYEAVLSQIVNSNDRATAIVELLPFTLASKSDHAAAAAATIHKLVLATRVTDLNRLERTLQS